ncbi:MAG: hypothetical protein HYV29_02005 [Ignavibacteriales bacterium]|nr:hypothetical protein [Ignavibacteriales bacterium]
MLRQTIKNVMVSPPAGRAGKAQVKLLKSSFDASLKSKGFAQDDCYFCAASNHFQLSA